VATAAIRAHAAAFRDIPTAKLTKTMERAMVQHQPPLVRGRRSKLRYAHQGGRNPPRIIVHGGLAEQVPESYRRYLANVFREEFDLYATPVRVEFRDDANPYARRGRLPGGKPRRETVSEARSRRQKR
jgi:GTP-binding protein